MNLPVQGGARATEAQLADARKVRADFTARLNTVLANVDAIVCPSGGAPAFPISQAAQYGSMTAFNAAVATTLVTSNPPLKSGRFFTAPMDMAGTPAICLPSGFSPEGLPYSIQFVGRRLSEAVLCRIAHAYEQATSWHDRHPDVDTA